MKGYDVGGALTVKFLEKETPVLNTFVQENEC